jgi:phenylpropionate dioxygenase-like ring-hydroxylating dioxygenase large terminal subunit
VPLHRPGVLRPRAAALFARSWLYAGFASELPEAGSFKLAEHLGTPVLLVRGEDDVIRAFYNVCRHRGGPLVNTPCGKSRMLVCQFHSWTYDLAGQLQHMPSGHDFPCVDKADIALVPVRCEPWGNMLFVNRDPDAPGLLDSLGPLVEDFAERNMDTRKVFKTKILILDCNWKVALEAFVETYHLARVHPNTVSNYVDQRGTYIQLYPGGHSTMYSLQILGENAAAHNPLGFEGSNEQRINRETIPGFTIFPTSSAPPPNTSSPTSCSGRWTPGTPGWRSSTPAPTATTTPKPPPPNSWRR